MAASPARRSSPSARHRDGGSRREAAQGLARSPALLLLVRPRRQPTEPPRADRAAAGRPTAAPSRCVLAAARARQRRRGRLRRRLRRSIGSPHRTQFLGLSLGLALASLAAALLVIATPARRDRGARGASTRPRRARRTSSASVDEIVAESGSRFTRKRLLMAGAGRRRRHARRAALLAPLALARPGRSTRRRSPTTPWRRGRRLVDEDGAPLLAADIEQGTFYTAFPEGADREQIGSPVVVVRLDPARAPPAARTRRLGAAAGSSPTRRSARTRAARSRSTASRRSPHVEPGPALVCPCHYSTFDPATGGTVLFGPAGRPLPQLPLDDRPTRRPARRRATSPARSARRGGASARGRRST